MLYVRKSTWNILFLSHIISFKTSCTVTGLLYKEFNHESITCILFTKKNTETVKDVKKKETKIANYALLSYMYVDA